MFISRRGCTRLQPIAAQESAWAWSTSCGVIVYCYFYVFRLINKGSLLFSDLFFIQWRRFHALWNLNNVLNRRQLIKIWHNYHDATGWLTGFVAVTSQSHHSCITVIIIVNKAYARTVRAGLRYFTARVRGWSSGPDLSVDRIIITSNAIIYMLVWLSAWSKLQTTLWSTYKLYDIHAISYSRLSVWKSIFMSSWVIIFYCFFCGGLLVVEAPGQLPSLPPPALNPALIELGVFSYSYS